MKKIVFYTGLVDIIFGIGLLFPEFYYNLLNLKFCNPIFNCLIALFATHVGVVVILTSRDIIRRNSYLFYTAWLKFFLCLILVSLAIKINISVALLVIGIYQVLVALFYLLYIQYSCDIKYCDVQCDNAAKCR